MAEGARLESVCAATYRGFESLLLRQNIFKFDSRVLCNKGSRTPPGPGGSNGSEILYVPQGCLAIIFLSIGPTSAADVSIYGLTKNMFFSRFPS